jgi:hypothetical protein
MEQVPILDALARFASLLEALSVTFFVQDRPFEPADLRFDPRSLRVGSPPVGLWTACAFERAEMSK